jgi:hypothetical protein
VSSVGSAAQPAAGNPQITTSRAAYDRRVHLDVLAFAIVSSSPSNPIDVCVYLAIA